MARRAHAGGSVADGFRAFTIRRVPERAVCWFRGGDEPWRRVDEAQSGEVALTVASVRRRLLHQRCIVLDEGVDPNVTANPVRYDAPGPWGR